MTLAPIDVHDLLGQPGMSRRSDVLGTIDGLATELVAVPEDAPLGARCYSSRSSRASS